MAGKADLIDGIASATGLSKAQAGDAFEALFESITSALVDGDKVQVPGFGSFSVGSRAARMGRNPKTGEAIQIPASNNAKFKAGKALKDALN